MMSYISVLLGLYRFFLFKRKDTFFFSLINKKERFLMIICNYYQKTSCFL